MRAPYSWVCELVELPPDADARDLAHRLTALGLKLEALHGGDIEGPVVVGRVLGFDEEAQKNGKAIRWCRVDVGPEHNEGSTGRGIVCGAANFAEGDLVVVALPGAILPGGFAITARKTYGHLSDGMISSVRELGTGDDHAGILVLDHDARPGDDALALLGLDDTVIEMEINPDRAYALSIRGVAREAALAYGVPFTDPVPAQDGTDTGDMTGGFPVRVEDPAGCPVFVARTVEGFDASAPTPRWMARRLTQAGMRPISLAVDVTNYVMLELGQPIHGYDAAKLSGPLVVRRALAGETLTTLDGVKRDLDAGDLLITDDSGPIGLAGVMGGGTTELSGSTTSVVVEAAHFDPASVFRTQRRHKLPSEASRRFERGVDPQLPAYAAERVARLLVEHGGGRIGEGVTFVGEAPPRPVISAAVDLAAQVTGMTVEPATSISQLEAVGCSVEREGEQLKVTPPSWRGDLTDPYDLVEEVARLVGYTQVPSLMLPAPPGRGLTARQRLHRRIGHVLAGLGLVEVTTYPFIGEQAWDLLRLDADDERRRALRLSNPLSEEEPLLTTTLLPGLLRTVSRNAGRGQADVAVFETASVFRPGAGQGTAPILGVTGRPTDDELQELLGAVPSQPRHLGVVLSGTWEQAGWWGAGREATWSDAVAVARTVAQSLDTEIVVEQAQTAPWHPGRCARISIDGAHRPTVVGFAGELHPAVCKAYGVPARTCAVELDLDVLVAAAAPVAQAPRLSTMPVAKEDVALVVDVDVASADVAETLREGAGDLLESVRLFDTYTGSQVGEGKKSLAFGMRFRAPDRTLTAAETTAARSAAVALAAQRHGAVQRT